MQHLGLPTPFLDFSTKISIALAFAAAGMSINGNDETDEYVSLYVFDKVYEYELGMPLQQMYTTGMANGIQRLKEYMMSSNSKLVDFSVLCNIDEFVKWYDVMTLELMYVEYQPIAPGVVTLSGQILDLSNPNLDRQNGCFILNLFHEKMPLEDNWNQRTIQERNHFWMNSVSGVRTLPYSGVMTRDKMMCFDIKKSVIQQWSAKNHIQLYDNSQEMLDIKQKLSEIQAMVDDYV